MKTTLMLIVVLLVSFSPLSAQVDTSVVNGWHFLGTQGGKTTMAYTRMVKDTASEGKFSQAFGANLSHGVTAYWEKKLDHNYPRPGAIAYDHMLSKANPNDWRISGYGIGIYLHYSDHDTTSLAPIAGASTEMSRWSHYELVPYRNGSSLPDSVDAIILELFFDPTDSGSCEVIMDYFQFVYLLQGPPVIRYRYEVVDRFGDPDPKPAMLSVTPLMDFGSVPVNMVFYKDTALVFRNSGDSAVSGTISVKGNNFFVEDFVLTIPPRDSVSKKLWLNTTTIGKDSGILVVRSNSSSSPDSISLAAFVIGAVPSAQPNKVVMGNTPVGTVRADTIRIWNNGNIVLYVDSVKSTDPRFSVTSAKDSIAVGGRKMYIVEFHSNVLGAISDTILFYNSSAISPIGVTLTGMVVMGVENPEMSPLEFSLSQNYPNPFNPSTTIEFQLPGRATVKITVYNMLGQEVGVIADGEFQAGVHQANWNAKNMPSGAYVYRINAGKYSAVKRMLLVK